MSTERMAYFGPAALKKKKGNRWLFNLPKVQGGYFEYAIQRVLSAAKKSGLNTYLIDGVDLADGTIKSYQSGHNGMSPVGWPQIRERMIAMYNQPLETIARGAALEVGRHTNEQYRFYKVTPR